MCEQREFSRRDVAVAMELNQRYIEILDEMYETVSVDSSVVISVNGIHVRLQENNFFDWMADRMSNGNQEP